MNRLLVSAALALSLAATATLAQDPQNAPPSGPPQGQFHRHAPNPERETARLTRELSLTPDQASKLEPILATRDQQVQALFQNQQLAPQDRHQQMKSIQETTQQQLANVLTPAQLEQMKSMRHSRRFRGQQGQQPPPPPAA